MGKKLTLILGGARSGKSDYAQKLAEAHPGPVLFAATATAFDEEMATRIRKHQSERPASWRTLEAPVRVGQALQNQPDLPGLVLIDCLTLLANNVIFDLPNPEDVGAGKAAHAAQAALDEEVDELLAAYSAGSADWLIVSNEVGLGLVPAYPLGRVYRDVLGRANQRLAQAADRVLFMVAGLPLTVKE